GPVATSEGVPVGWQIVGSGDLNGDGSSDFVMFNPTSRNVWGRLMSGASDVASGLIYTGQDPGYAIAALGDFNGDGKSGLWWSTAAQGQTAVWLMNGLSLMGGQLSSAPPSGSVVLGTGDFNHDGRSDVLWENTSTGVVTAWYMNGTAVASTATLGTASP